MHSGDAQCRCAVQMRSADAQCNTGEIYKHARVFAASQFSHASIVHLVLFPVSIKILTSLMESCCIVFVGIHFFFGQI